MIQSEEKSFKQYLKDISPIQVIFKKDKEYIYTILDKDLNVIFEHKAFDKDGYDFDNIVKTKTKELGLDINKYRNGDTIEDLKGMLCIEHSLDWQEQFHTGKKSYLDFSVPSYEEFDIEPSSEEFEKFKQNCIDVSLNNLKRFVKE